MRRSQSDRAASSFRPSPSATFSKIVAIAESLGFESRANSNVDPGKLRREQAERNAKKLVSLVQGTSALEGQSVDQQTAESMIKVTTQELLAGSIRGLWSED